MTALIPVDITNILVAYFCHTATEAQRFKLDEWICASDENMRVFDLCLESSLAPFQPDPDRDEELDVADSINLN